MDAFVLWFIVACGSDADDADGRVAGAAGIGGVLESAVAAAIAVEDEDNGVDNVDGVV